MNPVRRNGTHMTPHTEGYTLVETSVALALGLFVVGLAFSTYLFGTRMVGRWQHALETSQAVHGIGRRLHDDVRAARRIESDGASLRLSHPEGTVRYRWDDETLHRNDVAMHPASLRCRDVHVQVEPTDDGRSLLRIDLTLAEEGRSATAHSLHLAVATRWAKEWPPVQL